jgi:hypothetical protein
MRAIFKKSIILAAMTAMLTPQVFPKCNDSLCEGPKNSYIDNIVDRTAQDSLSTNQNFRMIAIERLKTALHEYYRAECFWKRSRLIGFSFLSPLVLVEGLSRSYKYLSNKYIRKNYLPLTANIFQRAFPWLFDEKTASNPEEEYIEKAIENNARIQIELMDLCERIAKKLTPAFYTGVDKCWGNINTNKTLRMYRQLFKS